MIIAKLLLQFYYIWNLFYCENVYKTIDVNFMNDYLTYNLLNQIQKRSFL